jgi:DNA-binding response OmpR family regulator
MLKKVLVVDDEPSVCEVLKEFLQNNGYNVEVAYSGDEAIAAYQKDRPDVVLLDVRMPGKDGLETLREIKSLDSSATVIMVTAVHKENVVRQAMDDGAADYITKPINPQSLELAIRTKLIHTSEDEA